jgi:hypothetical protein
LSDVKSSLTFPLHDAQLNIFDDAARYKVVAAGRRFGKSHLAAVTLLLKAMEDTNKAGYDVTNKEVYYIAPTFEQAKKIMWPKLKELGKLSKEGGIIDSTIENTAVMTLINGRRISIKGADRPDSLRGVGLSYVVLDEYAFMKPDVWSMIIRPTLADVEGEALFIGTPDGKNHFFDIFEYAKKHTDSWSAWQFDSLSNPTLNPNEIRQAIESSHMTAAAAKQEFGASFSAGGGEILQESWWKYGDEPEGGDFFIAVDPAGFTTEGSLKKGQLKIKDECSIAIVKVGTYGWWVKDIISGRWDVRETALKIIRAYIDTQPIKLGIEKGSLKNAIGPYLEDEMKRFNRYFLVWDLTPGGRNSGGKEDRIRWALQGRLEKGRLSLNKEGSEDIGSWQRKLIEQASDFPSPLSHDDLIDSLAYIDQLADVVYFDGSQQADDWQPLDLISGL